MTDVAPLLPCRGDGTLASYMARAGRDLGGRPFELIAHDLQTYDRAFWNRLRVFVGGLTDRVGLPADKTEAVLFLRDHDQSSFGLHKDDASIFMFILSGRKRILAWAYEAFAAHGDSFTTTDYAAHIGSAIVLEGGPGDVIYWPSSHWHVGETERGLSASISLGLRLKADPLVETARSLLTAARRLASIPAPICHPNDTVTPETLVRATDQITAVSGQTLERAVAIDWLIKLSAGGFVSVPPRSKGAFLDDADVVRVVAPSRVLAMDWTNGKIALAVNGHTLIAPAHPGVRRLIDLVNSGAAFDIGAAIAKVAPAETLAMQAALRQILSDLETCGAIQRNDPAKN